MGQSGAFTFSDGAWSTGEPSHSPLPFIFVEIHDSDVAIVAFSPAPEGADRFAVGLVDPATYFKGTPAVGLADKGRAARAFAGWLRKNQGQSIDAGVVESFIAASAAESVPEEYFVEEIVLQLFDLAGLPSLEALLNLG